MLNPAIRRNTLTLLRLTALICHRITAIWGWQCHSMVEVALPAIVPVTAANRRRRVAAHAEDNAFRRECKIHLARISNWCPVQDKSCTPTGLTDNNAGMLDAKRRV